MPTESEIHSRRDSWPPTQLRLLRSSSKDDPKTLPESIDEDPLTYFLTPTPQLEDEDDALFDGGIMMGFDAGIEDPKYAMDMVRSVSPSSLDGLSKPSSRSHSPDLDFDLTSLSEDDDEEEYIRFSPGGFSSRFLSLPEYAIDGRRPRPRSPLFGRSENVPFRPASFPGPGSPPRGRMSHATGGRGKAGAVASRSLSARGRLGHLWREPSPDVWSISEETEEDMKSCKEGEEMEKIEAMVRRRKQRREGKVEKKVRFVLPEEEEEEE